MEHGWENVILKMEIILKGELLVKVAFKSGIIFYLTEKEYHAKCSRPMPVCTQMGHSTIKEILAKNILI